MRASDNSVAARKIFVTTDLPGTTSDITLMTINIYGAHNQKYSSVINLVKEKNPEILCINEITKLWMQRLKSDLPEYKYRFDEGISGGAAIFSRVPIERVSPPDLVPVKRYGVRGRLKLAGRPVLICAVHPPAPTDRGRWLNRNREFDRLSADSAAADEPVILIGDFNSTPFSPYFRKLLKDGKLCDSENGKGIQPSWNALFKVVPPLVPIDHCLTSGQFAVLERYLGPNVGSDHLPVIVKLHLQEAKS
jgi:endonuclease/exonuclease/phosphatase (EEP) superfamily protein YafD